LRLGGTRKKKKENVLFIQGNAERKKKPVVFITRKLKRKKRRLPGRFNLLLTMGKKKRSEFKSLLFRPKIAEKEEITGCSSFA